MNPGPRRGEEKVHTSLTVAPAVAGADIRSACGPAHQLQLFKTAQGKCPAVPHHSRDYPKWWNGRIPLKKNLQEITTANELIKNDLNNITGSEFRIIVIKLIAGLENSIKDSRESIATEIKGLSNSQEEPKNTINEVQNKMEVTTARIEEAEERIGELEDKIMEKEEAEKKKKKFRSMRGKLEN